MAERQGYRGPQYGDGPIPAVTYSQGAAENSRKLARLTMGLADTMNDRLDAEAKQQGADDGATAGMTGTPELQRWGTLRGQAFNTAALQSYASKMDITATEKAATLYTQNQADPVKLKAGLEAYSAGQVTEISKLSPETASIFESRFATKSQVYVEKARDNNFKNTKDEADALGERQEAMSNTEIDAIAPDLFNPNPAISASASKAIEQIVTERETFLTQTYKDPLLGEESIPAQLKPYDGAFGAAATATGMDKKLLQAVSWNEIDKKKVAKSVSPVGAIGMMQVMPDTARDPGFGVAPVADDSPEENIRFGSDYLKAMMDRYGNDTEAALIAYNAGPANADKWLDAGRDYKALPKASETRPYVKNVLKTYSAFKGETGVPIYSKLEIEKQQQTIYDKVMTKAWQGYFRGREDKVDQYNNFMSGETKLRVYGDNGEVKEIDVRSQMTDKARAQVEDWMQQEITFGNSQADRQSRLQKEAAEVESKQTEYDYVTRINAMGQLDGQGQPVKAADADGRPLLPVDSDDVNRAVYDRRIPSYLGESMQKALTVARPAASVEVVRDDMMARMQSGEDIRPALLDQIASLNREDFAMLYNQNQALNVTAPEMAEDQKFYFGLLKQNIFPDNIQRQIGDVSPILLTNAQVEFRRRTNGGEKPEIVFNDINNRVQEQKAFQQYNALDALVPPRFSTRDGAAMPGFINIATSAKALQDAYNSKKLSGPEFDRQKMLLMQWDQTQKGILAIPDKKPKKTKE